MTQRPFRSLAEAVEAYYEELRRFVRRRTGSAALAEDIVQETWIRANGTTATLPDNPRAYLYRMAGNLAADHLRRQRARARVEAGGLDGRARDAADRMERIACPRPAPDEAAAAREELIILAEAVRELPEKCRLVFLLYRGEGLTMREIAGRLDISEKTVEKHVARAMLHCRRRLRAAGRAV